MPDPHNRAWLDGDCIVQELQECTITRRLRLDQHFKETVLQALALRAGYHGSERDKDNAIRRHLDTTDEPLSQLEKLTIYTYATDRNEA